MFASKVAARICKKDSFIFSPMTKVGKVNARLLAVSNDGSKIITSNLNNELLSSVDSGSNFISINKPNSIISSISLSGDGNILTALANSSYSNNYNVYIKNNSSIWTNTKKTGKYTDIKISNDGKYIFYNNSNRDLYKSSIINIKFSKIGFNNPVYYDINETGSIQVACNYNYAYLANPNIKTLLATNSSYIPIISLDSNIILLFPITDNTKYYYSNNGGISFNENTSLGNFRIVTADINNNGSMIIVAISNKVYLSIDKGISFKLIFTTSNMISKVAIAKTSNRIFISEDNGYLYYSN